MGEYPVRFVLCLRDRAVFFDRGLTHDCAERRATLGRAPVVWPSHCVVGYLMLAFVP
jgi:hypothetical protein